MELNVGTHGRPVDFSHLSRRHNSGGQNPGLGRDVPHLDSLPPVANLNTSTGGVLALLDLQEIHRRAAMADWPPAAYLEVARWMRRHRPEQSGQWLRLALEVGL